MIVSPWELFLAGWMIYNKEKLNGLERTGRAVKDNVSTSLSMKESPYTKVQKNHLLGVILHAVILRASHHMVNIDVSHYSVYLSQLRLSKDTCCLVYRSIQNFFITVGRKNILITFSVQN